MRVVGAWKKFIILLNFKKCLWTSSWIWNTNTFRLPSSSPPLSIISFFSHSKILAQNITNGQNGSSCCFMGAWRKPEKSQNAIPYSVKKLGFKFERCFHFYGEYQYYVDTNLITLGADSCEFNVEEPPDAAEEPKILIHSSNVEKDTLKPKSASSCIWNSVKRLRWINAFAWNVLAASTVILRPSLWRLYLLGWLI